MVLSTGTTIAEHRLHCSQTETLIVPSSPLTDEEYREYCDFLHSMTAESRGAWMAHRLPPLSPPPAPPMTPSEFDLYCEEAAAKRLASAALQVTEQTL